MKRAAKRAVWILGAVSALLVACGDSSPGETGGGAAGGGGAGAGTSHGAGGSGGEPAVGGGGGQGEGGSPVDVICPTEITFSPGYTVQNARVAGEWQGFDLASAPAMTGPSVTGEWSVTVDLAPGLYAYKVVYDDVNGGGTQWVLNPTEGRRKYVDGIENSAIKVRDCGRPHLDVASASAPAGQGTYQASLSYVDAIGMHGADPQAFSFELTKDGEPVSVSSSSFTVSDGGDVTVALSGLEDGKYRLVATPADKHGQAGEPLLLVFWIEDETFDWRDALIYMVMTDRFEDGDPSNDPGPTPEADPRGDFQGGDLEGLRNEIAAGTLDALGVRAIWLTPFQTNPTGAYLASDGVHKVTGYHGYWPVKAREVDPRLGGEDALRALVREAHAHGIRILQDFVVNHVHQDHEYVQAHPDWFRTGCVCGTDNCDWTAHALDCMFTSYLPDINHTVPEANAQFVDDAVWWLDTFDLDGLRVDAVKHVEEIATRNLAAEVRERFDASGNKTFLMGETAMGWNDCADPCNDENYGTISKYIGPNGLDGQFDFVLYHGVSYRTFAYGDKGMLHADYWVKHGLEKWPAGSVMTPYIGSHDTARFTTLADYRGQDGAHDRGIPGNQWSNTAVAPSDGYPYSQTRLAMGWLLGLPGAPLLYYGDEYGQWGGVDPNNRLLWRSASSLSPDESATLTFVRKLGSARRNIPALRRGDYISLAVTEDTLVFGRKIQGGSAAIVGLNRLGTAAMVSPDVLGTLGIPAGTTLLDAMGGPSVVVSGGGAATITIPARSVVILHP